MAIDPPIESLRDKRLMRAADAAFRELDAALTETERRWLDAIPLSNLIDALDRHGPTLDPRDISPEVRATRAAIAEIGGDQWVDRYVRLVLLLLVVRRVIGPPVAYRLPPSLELLLAADLQRIVSECQSRRGLRRFGARTAHDLAVARGVRFPCGGRYAETVAMSSGILEAAGLGHVPTWPWLTTHLDLADGVKLTAETRQAAYVRLGQFMIDNPDYVGSFGISWFDDPAIEKISPRLAFVSEQNRSTGAFVVSLGTSDETTIKFATGKSPTRRRLYEEGKYLPTDHAVIWLRDDLVRWAKEAPR
jgi:hypothetical protein